MEVECNMNNQIRPTSDSGKLASNDDLNGSDISFESLRTSVSKKTMAAIDELGFQQMTKIQSLVIPKLIAGHDLRATAKPGSGKTLAFLIPAVELLHRQSFSTDNGIGVLILSPTRELCLQTYSVLEKIMKYHTQSIGIVIGGTNVDTEVAKLQKGINILVATPGQLLVHLENTKFQFSKLCGLILDEADRILDMRFQGTMMKIIKLLPKKRQTMLFSATYDKRVNSLSEVALMVDPIDVNITIDQSEATVEGLQQAYMKCLTENRFQLLYTFIKNIAEKKVMVFFNASKSVNFYDEVFNLMGIKCSSIHGRQDQKKRTAAFNTFRDSASSILLCTDVAARGWDIPAVDWIIQYDPPDDPREYIHRVGRTARAGGEGQAILFLREEEMCFLKCLQESKVMVDSMNIPSADIDMQPKFDHLVSTIPYLHHLAVSGFAGYVRSYNSYKNFNVFHLDLKKVARCYGLKEPPCGGDLRRIVPKGLRRQRKSQSGGPPNKIMKQK